MKKIAAILISMLVLNAPANALNWKFWNFGQEKDQSFIQEPTRSTLRSEQTDKNELKDFLVQLNSATNLHDLKLLKTYYSKDFKSMDGFDHTTFFKMVEETFKAYPDIKYSSTVKSVDVYGDWATVAIYDLVSATVAPPDINIEAGIGKLEGVCDYILYFKKENDAWRVISDYVIAEETTLKYGDAKKIPMALESPLFVKKGEEYTLALGMDCPKDVFVLASLDREAITYPATKPKEAFRKLPTDGILERMVKAGDDGRNEYSMASIGITRLFLGEDKTSISFKMSGLALLMKRVNVRP